MKKVLAIVALAALVGSAHAQLSTPLPPSSSTVGVNLHSLASSLNTGATHWEALPGLASYKFTSDITLSVPKPGTPDNVLGLNWAPTSGAIAGHLASLNKEGGSVRFIFLGESAGWLNDVGFTFSGKAAGPDSYSLYNNIQALSGTPYVVNATFGDHFNIALGAGVANKFDFWFNGIGAEGLANPPSQVAGGVYTAFHQENSIPYNAPGNFMMTTNALAVNTWLTTTDGNFYGNVDTYLVSVEDWNLKPASGLKSDKDFNDFMFAVQFFDKNGRPDNPVPEPSTYGLIGAAALVGLVAARRFMGKKA